MCCRISPFVFTGSHIPARPTSRPVFVFASRLHHRSGRRCFPSDAAIHPKAPGLPIRRLCVRAIRRESVDCGPLPRPRDSRACAWRIGRRRSAINAWSIVAAVLPRRSVGHARRGRFISGRADGTDGIRPAARARPGEGAARPHLPRHRLPAPVPCRRSAHRDGADRGQDRAASLWPRRQRLVAVVGIGDGSAAAGAADRARARSPSSAPGRSA